MSLSFSLSRTHKHGPTHPPAPPPQVYAPSRTVVAYTLAEFCDKDADRKPHGVPGLGVLGLGPYYSR